MDLEYILSDSKIKKKTLNIGLRDKDTGKNYSNIYLKWDHAFAIWPRVVWPKIKNNKKDLSGTIENYLGKIEKHLKEDEILGKYEIKKFDRAFPLLQIHAPISKKELLEYKLKQIWFSKEEKEIIKEIEIPTHYLDYLRWNFGELGDIVKVDERVISAIKNKTNIETRICELHSRISELLENESQGHITRHKNQLHQVFEEYNGNNYEKIMEELGCNVFTNKLKSFWDIKKEISDEVFELDKTLKEIGDNCKARFYDRNERLKNKTKEYGLDIYFDNPELVKFFRKMNADDWKKQKWLFLDIEKPRFNTPEEEVSWVSLVYYNNGELKKETHTLREVGVKEIEGYKIFEHESVDELVLGLNRSIIQQNPFIISSYKTSFDLPELREASSQKFGIGVEEEDPKYIVSVPFFERMGLRGKVVFDMFNLARLMDQHLPNRKLELVSKNAMGDSAFGKTINYEQQRELEEIAIDGIIKYRREDVLKMINNGKKVSEMKIDELKANAAQKIAEYVGGDTDILPKLLFESGWGKKGLESICLFSDLFRIGIERLTTFNAINDVQKRLYFENVGIFEDFVYQKLKGATKQRQKAGQHFKNLKNKLIVAGNKKGLHKNVHQVYIPPSIDSLELLSIRKEVKEEMDKFPTIAENLLQKYFFGNMLNALMKEFNTDYGLYDKKKKALDENKSLTILIDQDFKRVYCSLKTTMKENSDWALKHLEKGTIKLDTFEKYLAMDKETTNFVLNKTVEIEDFFNAVKMAVSEKEPTEIMELNRAYSKFIGKHACSPETFWNRIENHYKKINEFLVDKGLEVVYKTGDYLYVTGNVASLKKDNSPLIPVDNLDSVYVADHIYYKKCGYYKGISVKDTPSDKMSVYEMRLFGGLIDNLLDEGVVKAIEEFKIGLCELDDELPVREMVYHTKSNNTYSAFVNGEKKKFYSVEEIVNVDFEMYQTKVLKKAETLIKPLIGLANARNILYGPNQLSLF